MQISGVGAAETPPMANPATTDIRASFDKSFDDVLSAQGEGDLEGVVGLLLQIIEMLMSLLQGKGEGEGQAPAGGESSASDSLSESLNALAEAVNSLAESISGDTSGTGKSGTGSDAAPQFDPADANQNGEISVFEMVDYHTSKMAEIQSMAKTPLDYVAGGRSYK